MIYAATITQKGQVTIPANIRKTLGLEPYGKVIFKKKGGNIILMPPSNFLSLKGSVMSSKIYSDEKADESVKKLVKTQRT